MFDVAHSIILLVKESPAHFCSLWHQYNEIGLNDWCFNLAKGGTLYAVHSCFQWWTIDGDVHNLTQFYLTTNQTNYCQGCGQFRLVNNIVIPIGFNFFYSIPISFFLSIPISFIVNWFKLHWFSPSSTNSIQINFFIGSVSFVRHALTVCGWFV